MRKSFFAAALALFASVSFAGDSADHRPARVDFSSRPSGVQVIVDGKARGVTPLALYDLSNGMRHVTYKLNGHEDVDFFVGVEPGARLSRFSEMKPEKGLLLILTEPSGCSISLDGVSFGETPRLVTSLDALGSYKFLLQKPGYVAKTVEVKFQGRTPVVKREKLILDSGTILVTSEPAGALVTVNGVDHGSTPARIGEVPKGEATVSLSLDGYKTVTRQLVLNAGDERPLHIVMEGMPGSLSLASVPDGARFYVNGEPRGTGSVHIDNLRAGRYTVRVELDGHAVEERQVYVPNGGSAREEFRLRSVLGRIELVTSPANATVLLDGRIVGTTRPQGSGRKTSDVLPIENIGAGKHTLVVKLDGYADSVKTVNIKAEETLRRRVYLKRVFVPDVEIETPTGKYKGVLVSNKQDALVLEVSMGITRTFSKSEILGMKFLEGAKKK